MTRLLVLAMVAAAATAAAQQPLVAGSEGVPVPKRIKMVRPEYPAEAQARGLRGIVILDLTIDADGRVAAVDVIRSIPGLDEAAIAAVRKWEYEPVKVGGRAVSVKLTVPITFLMQLPDITRGEGIPELRVGAVPAFPQAVEARGTASAVAELTIDGEGRVLQAEIRGGNPPYTEALLQAVRSWAFAPDGERGVISFRVQADFLGADRGQPRVALTLSGRRQGPPAERPAEAPAQQAPPEPTADPPAPAAGAGAPQGTPASAATDLPKPSPPSSPTTPVAEAPAAPAEPSPEPAPPAAPAPAPSAEAPVTEILRAPAPPPAREEPALSAVRDVTLGPGLPELTKGRRPVPPPLARMASVTGAVAVRFAIDAAGNATVQGSDGPELLRPAAESSVVSWVFRRTTTDRLRAVAEFVFRDDGAVATVHLER